MMLRERQWNAEKAGAANTRTTNNKLAATKHKTTLEDSKDGPTRPKRAALGDITEALSSALIDSTKKTQSPVKPAIERLAPLVEPELASTLDEESPLSDFDRENSSDPYAVSEFASDIFRYYKQREAQFQAADYVRLKPAPVTAERRARLVNFLIEVQEGFELNHETLYLAVKLLDLFISRTTKLDKSLPMLVAGVSIFIAAKMEERSVPTIDDLLYMIHGGGERSRHTPDTLKALERQFLRTVGYDLGAPLSYSFLRRYARVLKLSMQVLTTARFYLEASLHSLDFCRVSDSRIATAALLLALRVTKVGDWSDTFAKYSGYTLEEVEPLVWHLNHMAHSFTRVYPFAKTVIDKYSHALFFEVAKQPLLPDRIERKTIDVPELLCKVKS